MHDIRPFLPQLFSDPGTLLYIGARVDAHSWLEELFVAGNKITVLEVWENNAKGLVSNLMIDDLHLGDVRDINTLGIGKFDYVFWWHGPEHLLYHEIPYTLGNLEYKCDRLIALACPYGLYPQDAHAGNPYEVHQSTLHPEFFRELGYEVKADGLPDEAGSEIVAWKVIENDA